MSRIACPYCCTIQTFPEGYVCKNCETEVPEKYIQFARNSPPVYLAVVGMTAHGKTTYLHSLTHTMDNLGKIAKGSYLDALDDETLHELRRIRGQISTRTATESTRPRPKGVYLQKPMVFSLKGFMTQDRHPLVIYDLAGESFSDRAEIQQYAEPLKLAYTIWFVVSLYDLEKNNNEYGTIADLFNIYVTGMERVGASLQGRNLHVIYTKGDKLVNRLDTELLEYLRDDPYTNLATTKAGDLRNKQFDQDDYTYQLEQMSGWLQEFTMDEVPGGLQFINMVEDNGMGLLFSLNTAIGRDHLPNNQMIDYESYRVLDALIWSLREVKAIEPQKASTGTNRRVDASGKREIALILDTSGFSANAKIYQLELPGLFFSALSDYGEVKSFYMGTLQPFTREGMEPTNTPPLQTSHPLIGPILDSLSEDSCILVITCQSIWDLMDFHETAWHTRLGIITFDQLCEIRNGEYWPRAAVYDRTRTPQEQVKEIVKKLMKDC